MKKQFRFQELRIWQESIGIADEAFDVADLLDKKRLYRFAEQLRGAVMSISNNIAEGSGSSSKREFKKFLDMAHRSAFETANILILLERRKIISNNQLNEKLDKLEVLCRQIRNFQRALV